MHDMAYDPERITFFAQTDARGQHIPFGIKAKDRTRHVYVIGKTGMGKSTLLENMGIQDIRNGEGLAFIDPHGQTAEKLLDYIPEERKNDVLYFAPFDMDNPVSFNVMEDVGPDKRHLVVSGLMSVFEKIWVDAWSARMAYILQNTLMALLEYPNSTLLGVNQMLSNPVYRQKVIDNISDPAVKSFWVDEFLNYNERYMQEAGDAIKNKIGQFTSNPVIRNIIGQPHSSFDLRKIMDEQKILIMNLSKGLVGESNANLLGSMLTTRIYLAAMSRADLPVYELNQRPNFYFYVDEFQSFANATFANILSESRKYKLNLTIAHQYIEQMEEEVKNAVFGNVGTVISFRVGPFDAEVLETVFAPKFYAADICNLGFAQIYLTLMIDGIGSAPFSAVTMPPLEPERVSYKEIVLDASRRQFASRRVEVEEEIQGWHKEREEEMASKKKGKSASKKQSQQQQQSDAQRTQPSSDSGTKQNSGANQHTEQNAGNGQRPNTRNEANLSELRSVLAGISQQEAGKSDENKKQHTNRHAHSTNPSKQQPKKQNNHKVNDTKQQKQAAEKTPLSENKSDLKNALASVLNQNKNGTQNNNSKQPKSDKNTEEKTSQTSNTPNKPNTEHHTQKIHKQAPQKKDSPNKPTINHKQRSDEQAQDAPNKKHTNQESAASGKRDADNQRTSPSDTSNDDTIDPKRLERMMRVTTSDKPPFK